MSILINEKVCFEMKCRHKQEGQRYNRCEILSSVCRCENYHHGNCIAPDTCPHKTFHIITDGMGSKWNSDRCGNCEYKPEKK